MHCFPYRRFYNSRTDKEHVIITTVTIQRSDEMIEIPSDILNRLICVQCGGYLSNGPIMANNQNEQVCGRCFQILPESSKMQYVCQTAYEALAEVLIFPCRYKTQGCTHLSLFNRSVEHETNCPHRHSLSACYVNNNINTKDQVLSADANKEVDVRIQCKNSHIPSDQIQLDIHLAGKNGRNLQLAKGQDVEAIQIALQVAIAINVEARVVYTHLQVDKPQEHIYERISYSFHMMCVKCNKHILMSEIFMCPLGHNLCKLCKTNACPICANFPVPVSHRHCRNYPKGCTELFETADVNRHQVDCEFNDFKCPLCDFIESLQNLNSHFVNSHDCVILTDELNSMLSSKDLCWYFYCKNRLFECKYYNICDSIEFVVNYVGSNDNACNYKYQITLTENGKKVSKTGRCLGWNERLLGTGVSFQLSNDQPRYKLQAHIQII